MAKFEPPENEEERRAWIKRQKAKGVRAFKGRYGWAAMHVRAPDEPSNRRQQSHRQNIPAVSRRWRTLSLEQRGTWRVARGQDLLRKRHRQAGAAQLLQAFLSA